MATDNRIKEQLPELTRRIVETYHDVPTIHYLGHCPLPNYEAIVSACEDLKEILYPGYRRRENLHMGNVTYHVGDLVDGLHDKLTTQIGRALRHSLSAQRAATAQGVDPPTVSDAVQHCTEEGDFEALGQATGRGLLGAALCGRDLRRRGRLIDQRRRVERLVRSYIHGTRPFVISGCPSPR